MMLPDVPLSSSLEKVQVRGLIDSVLDEIKSLPLGKMIIVEGNCEVTTLMSNLLMAISHILQWFARRQSLTAAKTPITVTCLHVNQGIQIIFEDRTRRLSAPLRQRLFSPFPDDPPSRAAGSDLEGTTLYLPLYVAKVLVEAGRTGRLEDTLDELAGELGHRYIRERLRVAAGRNCPDEGGGH